MGSWYRDVPAFLREGTPNFYSFMKGIYIRMKLIKFLAAAVIATAFSNSVFAAPIDSVRSSVSAARVRVVLDSKEPIKYTAAKQGLQLEVALPDSSAKAQQAVVKDAAIKSVRLVPDGKKKSKLVINLNRDCQYKVYPLKAPNRLVVDIYRINLETRTQQLAGGVTYTYKQEEFEGRPLQSYLVSVAPTARLALRPFSAAGLYNGRGSVAKQAAQRGMLVALNASYFDTDGWVIGNVKENGNFVAMDTTPRSGYTQAGGVQQIIKDIAYSGIAQLPNGQKLAIKGMNRARIANDLVLFNSYYAPTTKTNQYGREVKLKNNHVVAIATSGNMTIEPGTVVLSGHGENADALASLRLGDYVPLTQTLGSAKADSAEVLVSGGPLLVEDGRVHVRAAEEQMASDIARGRAPRTALGLKKDGTLLLLVVDGRSQTSSGLTLAELAQYFVKLGADSAVNFDGGGSSEMVINGRIVNNPSDGRERYVSIGVGLFTK